MKKLLILLGISVLALTGCNDNKIYEGYIVDKIHEEEHTYTTMIKSGNVMIPQIHHVPDKWFFIIYNDEQIAKHEVSEEVYNTYPVFSYINLSDVLDYNPTPQTYLRCY